MKNSYVIIDGIIIAIDTSATLDEVKILQDNLIKFDSDLGIIERLVGDGFKTPVKSINWEIFLPDEDDGLYNSILLQKDFPIIIGGKFDCDWKLDYKDFPKLNYRLDILLGKHILMTRVNFGAIIVVNSKRNNKFGYITYAQLPGKVTFEEMDKKTNGNTEFWEGFSKHLNNSI